MTPEEQLAKILKQNQNIVFGKTIGTDADGNCTVQTGESSILARSGGQISAGDCVAMKADDGQWYAVSSRVTGTVQRSVLYNRKNRVDDAIIAYNLIAVFRTPDESLYVGGDRDEPELIYDIDDIEDGYLISRLKTSINKTADGYILNFVKTPPFGSSGPHYFCSIVNDTFTQVEFTIPAFSITDQFVHRLQAFQHGFYTELFFDGGLFFPASILGDKTAGSNFKKFRSGAGAIPFLYYVNPSTTQWIFDRTEEGSTYYKLRVVVDSFLIESDGSTSEISDPFTIDGEGGYTPFSMEGRAVSFAVDVLNNQITTPVFTDYSYSIPFRTTGFPVNQTQQINLNYLPNKTRPVNTTFGLEEAATTYWYPDPISTETSTTSRIGIGHYGTSNNLFINFASNNLFTDCDAVVLGGALPPIDKDFEGNVVINGTTFRRLRTTRYYYLQTFPTDDTDSEFYGERYLSYDFDGEDPLVFPLDIEGIDYSNLTMTCVRRPIYTYMQVTGSYMQDMLIGLDRKNAAIVDTDPQGVKTITIYNSDDTTTLIPNENAYLPVDLFDAFDFTGDAGTNYLTAPNATYSNGDEVACIGASLPTGIYPQESYYVRDMENAGSPTARFKLYRVRTIVPLPLISNGSGRVYRVETGLSGALLVGVTNFVTNTTLTAESLIRVGLIPREPRSDSFVPIPEGSVIVVTASLDSDPTIATTTTDYTGFTSAPDPTYTGLISVLL